MTESASIDRPRVRPFDTEWIQRDGRPALVLRDYLKLTPGSLVVPAEFAVILGLCDGDRDLSEILSAFQDRTGLELDESQLAAIVDQFDEALLLDSPRLEAAHAAAVQAYRSSPFRPMALADNNYPADPDDCDAALRGFADGYLSEILDGDSVDAEPPAIAAVISPHVDYQRGGEVYAKVWGSAAAAVRDAEVAVIFGTDHMGSVGKLTLTRVPYSTPYGVLPIDVPAVDAVANAIGDEAAFDEELHHRDEHSIELASVWLHHIRQGRPLPVVPVLCGSFQSYVDGEVVAADEANFSKAIDALRSATAGRKLLVVAAADLAHVGPAFGDDHPFGEAERAELEATDLALLEAACSGDPERFLSEVQAEGDRFRVCGLPPIYMTLRLADVLGGEVVAYHHCPADEAEGSWVSVAGVILDRS